MADILIRGMEMPNGCSDCKLNNDSICVLIIGCIYDETNGSDRRPDCPLVELPEHGDLIDRDVLDDAIFGTPLTMSMFMSVDECMGATMAKRMIRNIVKDAEAIIPAERESENGN